MLRLVVCNLLDLAVLYAVARQLQEQQLQARQLVLQQQAASAVAAASKTQREVCCSDCIQIILIAHIGIYLP